MYNLLNYVLTKALALFGRLGGLVVDKSFGVVRMINSVWGLMGSTNSGVQNMFFYFYQNKFQHW